MSMRSPSFVFAFSILAGCSGSGGDASTGKDREAAATKTTPVAEDAKPDPDVEQVRACFDRMLAGLEAFDRPAVLDELTGEKDEMRSAAFFLDYLVAGHAFETAFRDTHGDEAWEKFNGPEGASVQVGMPIDRAVVAKTEVEVDGDGARMVLAGQESGPTFRKVDGAWKLESTSVFPHDETGAQGTVFARMAFALEQARPEAEDASADLEALDRRLGDALKQALQPAQPAQPAD